MGKEVWLSRAPQKGDVVWAFRLPYFHCGIYEGDNSVIHFSPQNGSNTKKSAVIHRSSLEKFTDGCPLLVIEFLDGKCFPPEEVVEKARSRLSEHGYSFPFNNCDHFAVWCKTGEHRSLQLDLLKKAIISVMENLFGESGKKYTTLVCGVLELVEVFYSPELQSAQSNQPSPHDLWLSEPVKPQLVTS